jgi:hypothetical protein
LRVAVYCVFRPGDASGEWVDAYAKEIGVSLTFHVIDPATGPAPSDIPRGSGYQWQVSQARSLVADMFTLPQREPDLFMPNLYTAGDNVNSLPDRAR